MKAKCLAAFFSFCVAAQSASPSIAWQPWSDEMFKQAQTQHRFVLLDLGAVWCHWCHVMDEVTYADPKVIELINKRYLLVRVDQDARPDLSNRYEDYGWPATVVFNTDGSEIVKRQGWRVGETLRGTSYLEKKVNTAYPNGVLSSWGVDGTSLGFRAFFPIPRVGAPSSPQPWAEGWNAVGVHSKSMRRQNKVHDRFW